MACFYKLFITNILLQKKNTLRSLKKEEAFEILGLKKMLQKMRFEKVSRINKNHPDKGGSEWITKQINKARILF